MIYFFDNLVQVYWCDLPARPGTLPRRAEAVLLDGILYRVDDVAHCFDTKNHRHEVHVHLVKEGAQT